MNYTLTIDLDNDAFQPNLVPELIRILSKEINRLESESLSIGFTQIIFDINGNRIGSSKIKRTSEVYED